MREGKIVSANNCALKMALVAIRLATHHFLRLLLCYLWLALLFCVSTINLTRSYVRSTT